MVSVVILASGLPMKPLGSGKCSAYIAKQVDGRE